MLTRRFLCPNCFTLRRVLPIFCLLPLLACTKTLDTRPLESEIRDKIIRQGGLSLKSVTCPKSVPLETGKSFECVGELDTGDIFAIPVKQTDTVGTVKWEVANTKGLLNLTQLSSLFQQTLATEDNQVLIIDCGRGYRSVKPGDRFECKVSKPGEKPESKTNDKSDQPPNQATALKVRSRPVKESNKKRRDPKQPEVIAVAIDPERNVNWQQVFPAPPTEIASARQRSPGTTTASPTAARTNLATEEVQDLDERSD